MEEEAIIRQCCQHLASAASSDAPCDELIVSASSCLDSLCPIPVAGVLNTVQRTHPQTSELAVFRVLSLALMRCKQPIKCISFDQVRFVDGAESWLAQALALCVGLESLSFMMCASLTVSKLVLLLSSLPNTECVQRIAISRKLYDAARDDGRLPPSILTKMSPKALGASTSVMKDIVAQPLSAVVASQLAAANESTSTNEETAAAPRNSVGGRRQTSEEDSAWAQRVFSGVKIPVTYLFFPKGKRMIFRYLEMLRSSGMEGRVQADEVEQARRYLLRDPAVVAREEVRAQRKRERRRVVGSDSDGVGSSDDSGDDTLHSAMDVARKHSVSLRTAMDDVITCQGKVETLRRQGQHKAALSLERAVETIRREAHVKVTFKDAEKEARADSERDLRHMQESEDELTAALRTLKSHNFTESDVFDNNGRLVATAIERLNRSLLTAKSGESLLRAVQVVRAVRGSEQRASLSASTPSVTMLEGGMVGPVTIPIAEMDQWARATLRTLFRIDNVDQLIVARQEDIEEELDQLSSNDADRVRCALKTLQEIKYGRGVSEDIVQRYYQLRAAASR